MPSSCWNLSTRNPARITHGPVPLGRVRDDGGNMMDHTIYYVWRSDDLHIHVGRERLALFASRPCSIGLQLIWLLIQPKKDAVQSGYFLLLVHLILPIDLPLIDRPVLLVRAVVPVRGSSHRPPSPARPPSPLRLPWAVSRAKESQLLVLRRSQSRNLLGEDICMNTKKIITNEAESMTLTRICLWLRKGTMNWRHRHQIWCLFLRSPRGTLFWFASWGFHPIESGTVVSICRCQHSVGTSNTDISFWLYSF